MKPDSTLVSVVTSLEPSPQVYASGRLRSSVT
jgi:hypothetical protein